MHAYISYMYIHSTTTIRAHPSSHPSASWLDNAIGQENVGKASEGPPKVSVQI